MDPDQESLNKRIRETVSGLSDDDLSEMLKAPRQQYTAFAKQAAREELARRRQERTTQKGLRPGPDDPGALRQQAANDKRADCYIEVWSEKNFEGEHLRIEGPAEHQALDFAGLSWSNSISSLRVGPTAFVMVYPEQDFEGELIGLGPGEDVADLEELKFNDKIDSIRLVNSIKVFDGARADDASSSSGKRNKLNKEVKQGKKRGRRNL